MAISTLAVVRAVIKAMNRAYDRDVKKVLKRCKAYLRADVQSMNMPKSIEAQNLIDEIDLLLGNMGDPFNMDDKP